MSDLKIKKMIRNFFENDVSKELRLQFYHWFLFSSKNASIKEATLVELWLNTPSEPENSVLEQLMKVQQMIEIMEQSDALTNENN